MATLKIEKDDVARVLRWLMVQVGNGIWAAGTHGVECAKAVKCGIVRVRIVREEDLGGRFVWEKKREGNVWGEGQAAFLLWGE